MFDTLAKIALKKLSPFMIYDKKKDQAPHYFYVVFECPVRVYLEVLDVGNRILFFQQITLDYLWLASTQRVFLLRSASDYQFSYWDQIVEPLRKGMAPSPPLW